VAEPSGPKKVVYAALAGNLLIALTKFAAAVFTGSAAMLSEGIHSLVDTGNEGLLLYGLRRAALPPDLEHPFGHGRELYFWSFIVALQVAAVGAAVSLYEGMARVLHPHPLEHVAVSYVVLGVSAVFEGSSWLVALREFRGRKGRRPWLDAVRESKDPTTFTVLFEDSAALLGLVLAFAGIAAAQYFNQPELDGVASIGIGLLLAGSAIFLMRETKALLIGESASVRLEHDILRLAATDAAIAHANGVITVHLGPQQVVVTLSAEIRPNATGCEIELVVERLEEQLKANHPEIAMLLLRPQTRSAWHARQVQLRQAS
jgi:cation diffusion facilitator family transporter